ncbi:MAG: hypothetical protein ACXWCH_34510 [Burkholderiales bacterium]
MLVAIDQGLHTRHCCWAQREDGSLSRRDIIWFEPGEKHWHGAIATTAMTHIAIAEALEHKVVDRMEKVADEQHRV